MDQAGAKQGHRGAAGLVEQTASVLCVEIELRKRMDDQSGAQRQSSSRGKPGFAALAVLAVCFLLSALSRGLGQSFTVFLLPISETFGWNRGQVISVYSLASFAIALAAPLVGRMFDRFGPRIVYSLGLIVLGGAFLVGAYGQRLWQLQLSLGLCVGLGIAGIGLVPNSTLLGRWFGPRLPAAMAVVYSAGGAGVLMLLPASQLLIDRIGWRGAYQVFGGVILLLLLPLLLLPWKRFSEGSTLATAAAADPRDDGWTLWRAIRHHAFWGLFATFFFTGVGMFSISAQVVAYLVDAGFSQLQAATAWGFSGVTLLVGMFSIAWLDGIVGRRRSVLFSYALSISGIAMLWLLKAYPNVWLLTGFLVTFGSTVGTRAPLISATAMKLFRGKQVATIYGTLVLGGGLGAALGSLSGGLIHDLTGSYDALLAYALVSVIIGMIPFLVISALR
jgi:MFS family permease